VDDRASAQRRTAPVDSATSDTRRSTEPRDTSAEAKSRSLGLTSATGLVIGSIVGTGVFTLPAVLAEAGTMSLVVLGVVAVGSMLLAILFGQLTRRVPNSDGGHDA
jgi:APA family basic amino acid/polyamine antiporter